MLSMKVLLALAVLLCATTASMAQSRAHWRVHYGSVQSFRGYYGTPYGPGLDLFGLSLGRLLILRVAHVRDLLWGFDPQQFDIDTINRRLAELAPRKITRRKTAKPAAG